MDVLSYIRAAVSRSTQPEVADELGVSSSTVSRWLSGESKPTGTELKKRLADWVKTQPALPSASEDLTGELAGRSQELEALAAYMLERQKLLTEAIRKTDTKSKGKKKNG